MKLKTTKPPEIILRHGKPVVVRDYLAETAVTPFDLQLALTNAFDEIILLKEELEQLKATRK